MSAASAPSPSSPFAFSSVAGVGNDGDGGESSSSVGAGPPPPEVLERMASGAFLSLCRHLRERSDEVQNMDLMTIGGFCRNCLAKWMVLEARDLAALVLQDVELVPAFANESDYRCRGMGALLDVNNALDSFGYDEAARMVYGTTYAEWKSRHQGKATDEQLRRYQDSAPLHAIHDGDRLKTTVCTHPCKLSQRAVLRLQAGAFLRLCRHLRERSDEVQNMDLMTIGGFCRNCLAKWLVLEARKISKETSQVPGADRDAASKALVESLDSFGYDEAAQYVYGCTYPEWKSRHQKKATDEQMERYNGSKHLHAKHDKELLAASRPKNTATPSKRPHPRHLQKPQICPKPPEKRSLLSDVCCQDLDAPRTPASLLPVPARSPIPLPIGDLDLTVGILTVSDRAASDSYETGDLSGPAVETTLAALVEGANESLGNRGKVSLARVERQVVPDEMADIEKALLRWSSEGSSSDASPRVAACDLILTTGGTGFAPRDVTPEATLSVLDRECRGLMSWASLELTAQQPLSTLSRATAGTRGGTLIVNLPGNPKGAAEVAELLFPLLLHAIRDLRRGDF